MVDLNIKIDFSSYILNKINLKISEKETGESEIDIEDVKHYINEEIKEVEEGLAKLKEDFIDIYNVYKDKKEIRFSLIDLFEVTVEIFLVFFYKNLAIKFSSYSSYFDLIFDYMSENIK